MSKKIRKWITIEGTHIPLDQHGRPLSKVGKWIFAKTKVGNIGHDIFKPPEGMKCGKDVLDAIPFDMNEKQKRAFRLYSVDKNSRAMNARVNRAIYRNQDIPQAYAAQTEIIRDYFLDERHRTTAPIRVYRGLREKYAKDILETGEFNGKALNSTSFSEKVAKRFAREALESEDSGKLVMLVMDVPIGYPAANVASIARHKNEDEVLLPENVLAKMIGKKKEVNNTVYIHLQVLPWEGPVKRED